MCEVTEMKQMKMYYKKKKTKKHISKDWASLEIDL